MKEGLKIRRVDDKRSSQLSSAIFVTSILFVDANVVGEILIQLIWLLPLVRIYLEQEINFGLHLALSPCTTNCLHYDLLDHIFVSMPCKLSAANG